MSESGFPGGFGAFRHPRGVIPGGFGAFPPSENVILAGFGAFRHPGGAIPGGFGGRRGSFAPFGVVWEGVFKVRPYTGYMVIVRC